MILRLWGDRIHKVEADAPRCKNSAARMGAGA